MKKTLITFLVLALMSLFAVAAFKRTAVLSIPSSYTGITTNAGIISTNAPSITNLLVAALASTTNTYVSNAVVQVPASSAVLSISIVGTNANFTNAVSFTTQASYDLVAWEALTNIVMTGNVATNVTTNVVVTLNDYAFVRIHSITNANASSAFARFEVINK